MSEVKKSLQAIGFWRDKGAGAIWPDPNLLVQKDGDKAPPELISYLRSGLRVHEALGYSHCRFEGGPPDHEMGNAELTDGVWLWPEGLWVYVEKFRVKLPDEFVAHARSNNFRIPEGLDREVLENLHIDDSFWKSWAAQDPEYPARE